MKLMQDLLKFSSLIASLDDDSREWLKSPRLRSSWHRFFWFFTCTWAVNVFIATSPISEYLSGSQDTVLWFRAAMGGLVSIALILLFNLTIRYFAFTLQAGRPVRFNSVIFFYVMGTILFAYVYYFAFLAKPTLFQYDAARIYWFDSIGQRGIRAWETRSYFFLYSSLKSVGSSISYIESNSILTAIFNYIQSLFTFGLVSLLIAGYVNQKSRSDS